MNEKIKKGFLIIIVLLFISFIVTVFAPLLVVLARVIVFGCIIYAFIWIRKNMKKQINNSEQINNEEKTNEVITKVIKEATIDEKFMQSEKKLINSFIDEELEKNKFDKTKTIPYIENRKFKLTLIFSILNFCFISLRFFHLNIPIVFFLILNIIICLLFMKKYNIKSYIFKQVKARPDEEISNVVASIINNPINKNKYKNVGIIAISFILPLFIFSKPMFFYEKYDDGYFVRFYTIGFKEEKEIIVPETHKGKDVIGIRGNVFANLKEVEKIVLPDTIEIIRGNAFKNDINLKDITLPDNLTYLGGSAFKNCSSLTEIEIPESVTIINGNTFEGCTSLYEVVLHDDITEIHGSAFRNCSSLYEIDLPDKITEIRGNTFENCSRLRKIEIPEGVTRIGGHAFYGCTFLSEVNIPKSVKEIGSSAFRRCSSLRKVSITYGTYVNERAFKESPTYINRY